MNIIGFPSWNIYSEFRCTEFGLVGFKYNSLTWTNKANKEHITLKLLKATASPRYRRVSMEQRPVRKAAVPEAGVGGAP